MTAQIMNRFEWLKAAMQAEGLSASAKNVATALAVQFANEETCQITPSVPTLADYLKTSVDTIKRAVRALVAGGWLLRTEGRGRGNYTAYQLRSPGKIVPFRGRKTDPKAPLEKGADVPLQPEKRAKKRVQNCTGKGGISAPFRIEQSTEQKARVREATKPEAFSMRFDGNGFDGPTWVKSDRHHGLNAWADWLRKRRLPDLCQMPIVRESDKGARFFALPWFEPPTDPSKTEQALTYFQALLDEMGICHAAQ